MNGSSLSPEVRAQVHADVDALPPMSADALDAVAVLIGAFLRRRRVRVAGTR